MSIFREYDIRGIFGEDLNKSVVVKIGEELGREILARGGKSVGIGYDARKHSPVLFEWLCEGLGNSSWGMQFRTCENSAESAESSKKIRAKHPKKSFCYFWLLPKVESLLPYQPQLTKKGKIGRAHV